MYHRMHHFNNEHWDILSFVTKYCFLFHCHIEAKYVLVLSRRFLYLAHIGRLPLKLYLLCS